MAKKMTTKGKGAPTQIWETNVSTSPIATRKSLRIDDKRVLTSGNAGKILPIAAVPLLREDGVRSGRMRVTIEMMETAELLMNGVYCDVKAFFVPFLAFERFNGMDQLNRSYKGEPEIEGGNHVPFITNAAAGWEARDSEIMRTLGCHSKVGAKPNLAYIEAYNTIVNFRRKARSKHLTLRTETDGTLAEAFWHHTAMKHIVPDFDQALIDGEVPLNVVQARMPVSGIGTQSGNATGVEVGITGLRESAGLGNSTNYPYSVRASEDDTFLFVKTNNSGRPDVFAEMEQNGITVSLSNIEMAKQTAAFARLRTMYQGLDDDYIIDLLMSGVRVPEQAMRQPMLLDSKQVLMGYSQRYATDGSNLSKSATNGASACDLVMRLPPMNTGGVIMVTVEITPEQMFERQKDYFLYTQSVAEWPDYVRDYLDPEKVDVVANNHVDVDHSDPDATFGYAPLNHQWQRQLVNIGGKYYRPEVDASFDEDRQKIWAVETVDPTLTEDFYLCTSMHQKVFADTEADAFEIMARGRFEITGNTVFGAALREATDDYDSIMAQVDQDRIVKG